MLSVQVGQDSQGILRRKAERWPDRLVSVLTLQMREQRLRRETAEWLGVLSVQLTEESLEQELRGYEAGLTVVRRGIRHHVKLLFIAYAACRGCEERPSVPRGTRSDVLAVNDCG